MNLSTNFTSLPIKEWQSSAGSYSALVFFLNILGSSVSLGLSLRSLYLLGNLLQSERTLSCFPLEWCSVDRGGLKLENSSSQVILLKWSFTKHFFSKAYKCWEMGLISLLMVSSWCSRTLISLAMELYSKGQNPKAISQMTTPKLQISALIVQIYPLRIQGAMQMGDPNMVWARSRWVSRLLQNPKSPNLIFPLWIMMLEGLRSRCMILLAMSILKASSNCSKYWLILVQERCPFRLIQWSKVPPLQYSQKKQKLLTVLRIQMNLTTKGESTLERTSIQFRVHSSNLGFYLNLFTLMTFTATSRPVRLSIPRQTFPNSPSPTCSWRVQLSIIFTIRQVFYSKSIDYYS